MAILKNDITGIDVGSGSVKVVRISSGKRPRLIYAGIAEAPLDSAEQRSIATDIRYLLSDKRARSKKVVTLLPSPHLTIRFLTLPKMPRAELKEAVRWEAKRHISYPLDAAMVEHLILGEKKEGGVEKWDILMVAAERGAVIEHLVPFNEAGVKIVAVDANPLALRNNIYLLQEGRQDDANTMILDMGAGKTEINIFKKGGLRFSRWLEIGGLDITKAISEQLGIGLSAAESAKKRVDILAPSDADPVSNAIRQKLDGILLEIRRSVEYYKTTFREKTVEKAVLTGGGSLMNGIKDYFSARLGIPVEIDNPFEGLSYKKDILHEELAVSAPRFSSAVGLALRRA